MKIFIWGTGERASQFNQLYSNEIKRIGLFGYIDNSSKKWGTFFWGKKVYSPDILKKTGKKYIIIATVYNREIEEQILNEYTNCQYEIANDMLFKKIQLLARYEKSIDNEILEIMDYLKGHPLQVFNYKFVEKYDYKALQIYFDLEKKLFYTLFEGKRMYFARFLDTAEKVKKYYSSILIEQDIQSPHRYVTNSFEIPNGAVLVDAGVAEGNFSLSVIERVKKVYLVEPDEEWIEALRYTFEPYRDKVIIIKKFLSNYVNEDTTTIDEIVNEECIDFIKMDIEGEEVYALQGAKESINRANNIKCVVCTYHQEFAYEVIRKQLEMYGFRLKTSYGYMWYPEHSLRAPVLRHGLIRGEKHLQQQSIR